MQRYFSQAMMMVLALTLFLAGCGKQTTESNGDIVIVQSVDPNKIATLANISRPHAPPQDVVVQRDELFVRFFNVLDGDATFIRTPNGKSMLVDCGDSRTQDIVVSELRKFGVQQLDYLILSDPLLKNIGGCNAVLKQIPVVSIITNAQDSSSKPYRIFDAKAKVDAKNYTRLKQNMDIPVDTGITAHLLIPYTGAPENPKIEDNSIVTVVDFNDVQLLLMGDCGKHCEPEITKDIPHASVNLLKLAEQGSADGTTLPFINETRPKAVFISVEPNDPHGNPSRDMMFLLYNQSIPYYRTDYHGDITLRSDGKTFSTNTEHRFT